MPATTAQRTQVRIEMFGDGFARPPSDAMIDYYFDGGGADSVLLTAALCCEALAGGHGGNEIAVVSLGDGVSIDRHLMPAELRKRGMELRRRYLNGDSPAGGAAVSVAVQAVWSDHADAWDAADAEFG
jgi:hypothetical protein